MMTRKENFQIKKKKELLVPFRPSLAKMKIIKGRGSFKVSYENFEWMKCSGKFTNNKNKIT